MKINKRMPFIWNLKVITKLTLLLQLSIWLKKKQHKNKLKRFISLLLALRGKKEAAYIILALRKMKIAMSLHLLGTFFICSSSFVLWASKKAINCIFSCAPLVAFRAKWDYLPKRPCNGSRMTVCLLSTYAKATIASSRSLAGRKTASRLLSPGSWHFQLHTVSKNVSPHSTPSGL